MKTILDKTLNQFEQNLPFVVYRRPNENNVVGIFQKNDILFLIDDFKEKGFAFCSFDGNQLVLIPENQSEVLVSKIRNDSKTKDLNSYPNDDQKTKKQFEDLVSKGIQAIKENQFQKVVLSRKEIVSLNNFDLIKVLQKVVQDYPTAFSYCFFHPKIGLWFGATPEQLLQVSDSKFSTVALAGTQKNRGLAEVIWQEKEKQEQKFVTNYILENLKRVSSNIKVSNPKTIQAENLLHIKTIISGVFDDDFNLKKSIEILHPTPAVCGLPKEESKVFIFENENYDRAFYTGFLGELNIGNKTDLFVNLRCMQVIYDKINKTKAILYMGCGITIDSIPEKEWQESINKSVTMKKIVDLEI